MLVKDKVIKLILIEDYEGNHTILRGWAEKIITTNQYQATKSKKNLVDEQIFAIKGIPTNPVWWDNDKVLAIGVIDKPPPHTLLQALSACKVLERNGFYGMRVEVYDVLKIQKNDDWVKLKEINCHTGLRK